MLETRTGWSLLILNGTLMVAGCGDDAKVVYADGAGGGGAGPSQPSVPAAGDGAADGEGESAQYLFGMSVAGDGDNGSLYLMIQDELNLDLKIADIPNANAIEFVPGDWGVRDPVPGPRATDHGRGR